MNVDHNRVGNFFNPSHNTPKQIPYLAPIMRKNNTKWLGQVINQMVKKKTFSLWCQKKFYNFQSSCMELYNIIKCVQ
jgi:hypothetical protein